MANSLEVLPKHLRLLDAKRGGGPIGTRDGNGRELIRTAWYLTFMPGLAIVFTVLALNLIGDGLNDALNPRFSEERA